MSQNFLTTVQAAKFLGLQPVTLEAWRHRGGGPKFVKLGSAVRYRPEDLNEYAVARTKSNTSDVADANDA